MTAASTVNPVPKATYFSIWMSTFRLFRRHIGLMLWTTLFVAAPFFFLNALLHAHHMMTLGGAALSQTEIPVEQMRVLWLSLVCGDTLAFIALSVSTLLVFQYLCAEQRASLLLRLGRLLRSLWFWLFAVVQIIVFMLVNTPEGSLKVGGMLLFAVSVLLLLASQDRDAPARGHRLRQLRWTGWLSLIFALLTFPVLFILLNGFADYILLMLMDMGAARIMDLFEPGSQLLPFGAICVAKFISQWFNLLPMALLLCTYQALRGVPVEQEKKEG